ncbi:hypothetical protein [uncultured Helicobacter sp.]|nr:hypothetical protein [uncultured Helicobacter sp.]
MTCSWADCVDSIESTACGCPAAFAPSSLLSPQAIRINAIKTIYNA